MDKTRKLETLFTSWGEVINKDCPLNDYPRPQMRRDNWLCLNGPWQYAFSKDAIKPQEWEGDILVPFSPESPLSGVLRQLQEGETLWYFKEVEIKKSDSDSRIILHFGAVDQHCKVWCNDILLGEHSGGYWPFYFDITDTIGEGMAAIMLAVTDDTDQGDEAWGKQRLEAGKIWYTGQSGIWQTVWCEEVPSDYIENILTTPIYQEKTLKVNIEGGLLSGMVRVLAEGDLVAKGEIKDGEAKIFIPNCRSWHPDDPFLYDLEISAGKDKVFSYFGMREFGFELDDKGVAYPTLNGKAIFHNGLLDQGYWSDGMYTPPSDEAMVWDIVQIKSLGYNMLRKHIKIEPLRWYYHCDRLGIMVWQDFVNGGGPYRDWVIRKAPWIGFNFGDGPNRYKLHGRSSSKGRDVFERDLKRTIKLLYNSVSLGVWVPFNEGWGQFDAKRICSELYKLDQTRLIDHASGYFDQGVGDFHSYHIYYKRFRPKNKNRRGRVLALTEFGGFSLPIQGHMASSELMGYKIFTKKEELTNALEKLYEKDVFPYIKEGLGVLIYTQVSDIEDEINGLFTYDRKVIKINTNKIKSINNRIYEEFNKERGTN